MYGREDFPVRLDDMFEGVLRDSLQNTVLYSME